MSRNNSQSSEEPKENSSKQQDKDAARSNVVVAPEENNVRDTVNTDTTPEEPKTRSSSRRKRKWLIAGEAIGAMERVAEQVLPANMGYEWSGISLEEQESGSQAPLIFGLGLILVFLVLAAQYENYIDPLIILLSVPLAIMGALLAQSLRGFSNDVYTQIGLVMLIGLASKNAILIVEFANQLREQGLSITKAAVQAAQARLRPILMTAISTLLGIFPLVIAQGAGAGSRQSLGTAVFGGMLLATFLSLFFVPILYIIIDTIDDRLMKKINLSEQSEANSQEKTPVASRR